MLQIPPLDAVSESHTQHTPLPARFPETAGSTADNVLCSASAEEQRRNGEMRTEIDVAQTFLSSFASDYFD